MSVVVLWLFVIFSGVAVGAGVYELRVNVPRWFPRRGGTVTVDAAAMIADDSGRRFWAFVTTGPLTLLTIASLVLTWHPSSARDAWWFAAAAATMAERAGTFGYFIPVAIRLARAETVPDRPTGAIAARWAQLNVVRIILASGGWLFGLKALSLAG